MCGSSTFIVPFPAQYALCVVRIMTFIIQINSEEGISIIFISETEKLRHIEAKKHAQGQTRS